MSEALAITDEAALFNDPDFTRAIQERTKARALAAFHGKGVDKLIEIAEGDDNKTALSAITLLGKLAGEFKAPRPVMLSFEELRRAAAAVPAGPLGGITQIREAEVVEGDVEDDDDDEHGD